MKTKTAEAFQLFNDGKISQAYAIFKTFKLGLTPEERRAIQITHEVSCGRGNFYASVGVDIDKEKIVSLAAIEKLRK